MTTTTGAVISLLRPKQWLKNGFVLAPLVFSGEFAQGQSVALALAATALFCVGASAAYIVNDLMDVEHDRRHPIKNHQRPLAAGHLQPSQALVLLCFLYAVLAVCAWLIPHVAAVVGAYLVLNFAYSLKLKHLPVVDVFVVAICFVLRVYAGALALDVPVSSWMFITTLCLALFLASIKRRQELKRFGLEGREVLGKYSAELIDRYAGMSSTGALVFYSMFVMSTKPVLVPTIPLVLFGLFRYWYIVDSRDGGESPTDELVADLPLLAVVGSWFLLCFWLLAET